MKTACFSFCFDSEKEAGIVFKSLEPEIKHKIPKTDVKIDFSNKMITIEISTNDISSLRAACNSYLRWIKTIVDVNKNI